MEDVSKNEGRTVLFVSHNMQAISNLCNDGIYLVNGNISMHDSIEKVIKKYVGSGDAVKSHDELMKKVLELPSDEDFKLSDIVLYQDGSEVFNNMIEYGKPLEIDIHYQLFNKVTGFRIFLDLCDEMGNVIFRSFHDENTEGIISMEPGKYHSRIRIPANLLAPIIYDVRILFGIHNNRMLSSDGITIRISVEQTGTYNNAYSGQYSEGKLCPSIPWEVTKI